MSDLIEQISKTDDRELEAALDAVLARYAVLFPDWEVSTISIQKSGDRNTQLDRMISVLQNLKTAP